MFGQQLSDTFVVEAVGLPLRIGQEKTDKFGVLTLYRRKAQGQPTGFATINIQLLLEAAYKISGLVSAVLKHRDDMWEKEEGRRRQEVYQGVNSTAKVPFERRACWHVLKSFRAVNADFYTVDRNVNSRPIWLASARRSKDRVIVNSKRVPLDELVQRTLKTEQVAIERKQQSPNLIEDPLRLKTEGLVTRTCIPLVAAKQLRGILDVRWDIGPDQAFAPEIQHSDEQLIILGQILGSAYLRHQMLHESKQSTRALEAVAAYSAQRGHLMRNTINEIYDQLMRIKQGRPELDVLDGPIKIATDIVNETISLGKRVAQPSIRQYRLSSLIDETLAERDGLLENRILKLRIRFINEVPDACMVKVDPHHTRVALFNLLNNAIDAIEENKKLGEKLFAENGIEYNKLVPDDHMVRVDPSRRLFEDITDTASRSMEIEKQIGAMLIIPQVTVKVTTADHRRTRLLVSDNGVGMTKSEISDALSGFVEASDQTGVGVLISRLLLAAQGGTLRFNSKKYVTTDAILTLRSGQMENIYETGTVDGPYDSDSRE
jgi:signal transduction histidine kinase